MGGRERERERTHRVGIMQLLQWDSDSAFCRKIVDGCSFWHEIFFEPLWTCSFTFFGNSRRAHIALFKQSNYVRAPDFIDFTFFRYSRGLFKGGGTFGCRNIKRGSDLIRGLLATKAILHTCSMECELVH